jgi:hypothetical protein
MSGLREAAGKAQDRPAVPVHVCANQVGAGQLGHLHLDTYGHGSWVFGQTTQVT